MAVLIADPETKEILLRLKEVNFAFGRNEVASFCQQVKDYVSAMQESEESRIIYKGKSPQRLLRAPLLRYMMRVAEIERLCRSTLFTAMYIYDRFSDFHTISRRQIHLVVMTCLVLAGKLEERDTKTPRMKKLRSYLPSDAEFSYKLFTQIEAYILRYFDFKIITPTAYHFVEFFLLFSLDGSEVVEADNNNISCEEKMKCQNQNQSLIIKECAFDVVQTLLEEEPRDEYHPSCVGAAALMYARRYAGFNFWTQRLCTITGYSHAQVVDCLVKYIEHLIPRENDQPTYSEPSLVCVTPKFVLQ